MPPIELSRRSFLIASLFASRALLYTERASAENTSLSPEFRDILSRINTPNLTSGVDGDGALTYSSGITSEFSPLVNEINQPNEEVYTRPDTEKYSISPIMVVAHWDSGSVPHTNDLTRLWLRGSSKSAHVCIDSRPADQGGIQLTMPTKFDTSYPQPLFGRHLDRYLASYNRYPALNYFHQLADVCAQDGVDVWSNPQYLSQLKGRLAQSSNPSAPDLQFRQHSLGIESTGVNFSFSNLPDHQLTANFIATISTFMKAYRIPLPLTVGHGDIQDGKVDVGDQYRTYLHLLVYLHAVSTADQSLLSLIPITAGATPTESVANYFSSPLGRFDSARLGPDLTAQLVSLAVI